MGSAETAKCTAQLPPPHAGVLRWASPSRPGWQAPPCSCEAAWTPPATSSLFSFPSPGRLLLCLSACISSLSVLFCSFSLSVSLFLSMSVCLCLILCLFLASYFSLLLCFLASLHLSIYPSVSGVKGRGEEMGQGSRGIPDKIEQGSHSLPFKTQAGGGWGPGSRLKLSWEEYGALGLLDILTE